MSESEYRKIKIVARSDPEHDTILDRLCYKLENLPNVSIFQRGYLTSDFYEKELSVRMLYPTSSITAIADAFSIFLRSRYAYHLEFKIGRRKIKAKSKEETIQALQNSPTLTRLQTRRELNTINKLNCEKLQRRLKELEEARPKYIRMINIAKENIEKVRASGGKVDPEKLMFLKSSGRGKRRVEREIAAIRKLIERINRKVCEPWDLMRAQLPNGD